MTIIIASLLGAGCLYAYHLTTRPAGARMPRTVWGDKTARQYTKKPVSSFSRRGDQGFEFHVPGQPRTGE